MKLWLIPLALVLLLGVCIYGVYNSDKPTDEPTYPPGEDPQTFNLSAAWPWYGCVEFSTIEVNHSGDPWKLIVDLKKIDVKARSDGQLYTSATFFKHRPPYDTFKYRPAYESATILVPAEDVESWNRWIKKELVAEQAAETRRRADFLPHRFLPR